MKKITLDNNNRFEHQWITGIHNNIPASAINVSDADFMILSQNHNKTYDKLTKTIGDYVPAFILADAQTLKKSKIRAAFTTAEQLPVTDTNGVIWSAGYNSAMKLDAAKRMAVLAAQANVVFYDANNIAHTLTIADAEAVILQVGADFQTKFAAKQALMTQVDALPSTATQADLDAIIITI